MPAELTLANWAGTCSARPQLYAEPASVAEVAQLLVQTAAAAATPSRRRRRIVRVVGGLHSPNDGALTDDTAVSLRRMRRVLAVDRATCTVKVEGGIYLRELNEALVSHGLALPNLGSISDQTLAGCIATSTHGTGLGFSIFATHVVELQVVLADGRVVVSGGAGGGGDDVLPLDAVLCGLGCLGVVTGAVIKCVPAFDLRAVETCRPSARLDDVLRNVASRAASSAHYRFWWLPHTHGDKVVEWRADPVEPLALRPPPPPPLLSLAGLAHRMAYGWHWLVRTAFGYHALQAALWAGLALPQLVPLVNQVWSAVLFPEGEGSSFARTEVDRSDRVFNMDCLFRQRVDEWSVPLANLSAALAELRDVTAAKGFSRHFPVEVRFVAGDSIWLSPAFGPGLAFAYVGVIAYRPYGFDSPFTEYFEAYERVMARHGGRPHWAKVFGLRGDDFARLYPRWADFKELRRRIDPGGLFVNPWVARTLGLEDELQVMAGGGEEASGIVSASLSWEELRVAEDASTQAPGEREEIPLSFR